MGRTIILMAAGVLVSALIGCTSQYAAKPTAQVVDTAAYRVELRPISQYGEKPAAVGYQGFRLILMNKTAQDMTIDWNKTLYLRGGQADGRFMWTDKSYVSRDHIQPADTVFFNSTFEKAIWPNSLVEENGYLDWSHSAMPAGKNGIYLTFRMNGQEVKETMYITIAAQ